MMRNIARSLRSLCRQQRRSRVARLRIGVAVLATCSLAACTNTGGDSNSSEPYAGKRVSIIVGSSAGGPTDLTARAIAPLLQKHIAGDPTTIIENRAGAGGITGTNYFANQAPKDGTSMLLSSGSTHTSYALQAPDVQFDLKDMYPLLGTASSTMIYVRADTGIKKPSDIAKPTKVPLIYCGQAPTSADLIKLLALDLLGVKYKALFGFEGASDANIAFQRNECNIAINSVVAYSQQIAPEVEKGTVIPIMQTGYYSDGKTVRLPSLPEYMTPMELYKELHGSDPSGEDWDAYETLNIAVNALSKVLWLPKSAPENAIASARDAITKILNTPKDMDKLTASLEGSLPIPPGDELNSAVDAVVNADPASIDWLHGYLKDRWNADVE